MAVTLSASARYGYGGKQFVARILGRDSKFTFRREFIGRKGGKRGEDTSVEVDDPGLYETRDIDSKGRADDSYFVVALNDDGEARKTAIDKDDAMKLARAIDEHMLCDVVGWHADLGVVWTDGKQTVAEEIAERTTPRAKLERQLAHQRARLANSAGRDPEGMVTLDANIGDWAKGTQVKRADLVAWREAEVTRIEAEIAALDAPVPTAERPEVAAARAALAALTVEERAVLLAELS